MSINVCKDRAGRTRYEFEFSRLVNKERFRTRKLLPASWSRSQAEAYDRKRCGEIYAEISGISAKRWLIDDAIARYNDERAVELKHGKGTAAELWAMAPYWRGRALAELPTVCQEFTKDHRMKLAPATIMNRLRYLIAACRWGWKRHRMGQADPGAGIAMPAVSNKRRVYIDRAQMLRLARACKDRPTRAAIRIAFYSGMRLGEVERAGRNFEYRFFYLLETKNGEPRTVPMHPKVRCCSLIVQGTRFQTGYHFRKARALVGLDHVHFHDLRHSAASAMIDSGVDLYTIGAVLGHKSQASTARYAHLAQAKLRDAVGQIGRRA